METKDSGKRLSDVAHNIISYCREHRSNTDVLTYTREEAMEYVTAAIQQAVSESSAPQNGEVGELVKVLTERWKEYRDASVDSARSFPERMAAGGHAGGLKEAIDALTRLSQPSTPSERSEKL